MLCDTINFVLERLSLKNTLYIQYDDETMTFIIKLSHSMKDKMMINCILFLLLLEI
jgi:hypothetical protein